MFCVSQTVHFQYVNDSVFHHYSDALCHVNMLVSCIDHCLTTTTTTATTTTVIVIWSTCHVDHTLHAGLDDLLQVAQAFYVDDPDKLVRAAAQGNLDIVREVVRKHPSKVWGFELIYTRDTVDIMQ